MLSVLDFKVRGAGRGHYCGVRLAQEQDQPHGVQGMKHQDWRNGGFGLYIHWPFCESKCPYCDFNSHVSRTIDQGRWKKAYVQELHRLGAETRGRTLQTVYFGGGTPSLMQPDLVGAILETVRSIWPTANDPEITLEANPGTIEAGRFAGYHDAGVNRVSMGMQAMNDRHLAMLGRKHTAKEARTAFEIARRQFDRVSFDLIYARQEQSLEDWRAELRDALTMAGDHLSLYQLTIEEGTAFGDRQARGGLKGLPSEDLSAELYAITQELCDQAGLPGYEISNHARPGSESRHNMIYWRGGDYIGIGPGAHGRLTLDGRRLATEAPKSPNLWLSMVESGKPGELPREVLSTAEHALEYLLMSLRLSEGLELSRYEAICGKPLNFSKISGLAELGMVALDQGRIRATQQGRMVLNAILRELAD